MAGVTDGFGGAVSDGFGNAVGSGGGDHSGGAFDRADLYVNTTVNVSTGYWQTITNSTTNISEIDLGYSTIRICRPKFIWFECTGLRPNTPHWIFFNGVDVTRFVKTGIDQDTFNAYPKNDTRRNPGDLYLNEDAYPAALGGPTAASGPLTSTATGSIYGIYYLQSNSTVNFPTGTNSLYALDISTFEPEFAISLAKGSYDAVAQYQYYYDKATTTTTTSEVWVTTPTYSQPANQGATWDATVNAGLSPGPYVDGYYNPTTNRIVYYGP